MKQLVLTVTVCLGWVSVAQAGDIHYASVKGVAGEHLHIEYRGPSGSSNFVCSTNNVSCTSYGTTSPLLTPELAGAREYTRNKQGTLGLRHFSLGTHSYHVLYDISVSPPRSLGIIPMKTPYLHVQFTDDGNHLVVIFPGEAQRYTIATRSWGPVIALSQNELPFRSVSAQGTYLSAYNYSSQGHRIWNLTNGVHFTIPSSAPSYVEFSEDETLGAYTNHAEGFKTLYLFPVSKLPTLESTRLTSPPGLVEDYLFVGSTLFFIANQTHPLMWSLYAHERGETKRVEEHVSYGGVMKRLPENALAYLITEGKNTHVTIYSPHGGKKRTLAPIPSSPATSAITRSAKEVAGRHGVLLSPKETRRTNTLFIWLHGGPQRQTSIGYHPYLSYAVYDELLEKMAESGAYVYKLDYTGSWGYGKVFQKSLHKKIGVADIADISRTIDELKKELSIRNVYLIGNSYGGYLALKGVAELSNDVNGAISINGVSNWHSLISRIPSSPFATLFEGPPSQANLQAYFASEVFSGLVNHVRNQPILVVYGERDSTVPVWQSTEYIEFAREKGKNIHVLALPDEDHILRTRLSLDALCESIKKTMNQSRLICGL